MISHNLCNLVSDSPEEDCDTSVALLKFYVDSCLLKLGYFSNNYVSLLKYEPTMKNLIDN